MAAIPSSSGSGPDPGSVVVVGPQFCSPHVVDLTVTKKALSISDRDFVVTDVNGNVVLKVKGDFFSLRDRCVLLDAAGNPLLTLQQKILSVHSRWQVYRGDSIDPKDLLFSVKKSRLLQMKTELDVIMASNTNEDACDYKVKGSYSERTCTIYVGNSNSKIIAQMRRKQPIMDVLLGKDTFGVTVYPNVDHAFIASLIVLLDEINKV